MGRPTSHFELRNTRTQSSSFRGALMFPPSTTSISQQFYIREGLRRVESCPARASVSLRAGEYLTPTGWRGRLQSWKSTVRLLTGRAPAAEWDPSGSLLRGQFALGFLRVLNLDLFYSLKESTGRDSLIWSFLPQTQKRKPLELSYLLLGNSQELGTQSTLGKTPQLRVTEFLKWKSASLTPIFWS